jgi:hypothetical protein
VGFEGPDRRTLSADAGVAWWRSSGDDVTALDAEVRWRPREGISLGLGTSYSLYRYDLFTLSEQSDVRETFVKARWETKRNMEVSFRYAAENRDGELIHEMELGCAFSL